MKFPKGIKVYGDKSFRGACPSETMEQVTIFNRLKGGKLAKVAMHIRNEGKRSYMQTSRHKSEGMLVGAADIIILGSPTFVCELKRRDHTKGKLSKEQVAFLLNAQEAGCFVCIALGADAFKAAIKEWTGAFACEIIGGIER